MTRRLGSPSCATQAAFCMGGPQDTQFTRAGLADIASHVLAPISAGLKWNRVSSAVRYFLASIVRQSPALLASRSSAEIVEERSPAMHPATLDGPHISNESGARSRQGAFAGRARGGRAEIRASVPRWQNSVARTRPGKRISKSSALAGDFRR